MDPAHWLVMPQQVEAQVARWEQAYPQLLRVEAIDQYTGHRCLGLTVGEGDLTDGDRPAVWFCVPHAHEPAGTAAIMDLIEQLLTGHDLGGRPTQLDYRSARGRLTLVFNPDANPGGRAWSPCLWWDGAKYTNDEFWTWMRGLDPQTFGMWQRVARWDLREEQPLRRGIVYEQLNRYEFVEPNRDPGSSLVRLFRQMDARHRFVRSLHLHQTEFVGSAHDCMINLPVLQPELPEPVQEANLAWGRAIIGRWGRDGANPVAEPRAFPYPNDAQTVRWFRDCWGDAQSRAPELVVEVQNNSPHTPPERQLELEQASMRVTIEQLLDAS